MATITIDGKEYNLDILSDEAKNQLTNVQFIDNELARLNARIAVCQTARIAYAKALNDELVKFGDENIRFS